MMHQFHSRNRREEEFVNEEEDFTSRTSAELPTPEKLRSEVLSKALSHPLTTVPLIVALLLGTYSIAIAPFFGGFLITFSAAIATGLVGAVNGALRFLKGQSECEQKLADLLEQKLQREQDAEREKVERNMVLLKEGFFKIARAFGPFSRIAKRGLKEVNDLIGARKSVVDEIQKIKEESRFSLDITARVEPLVKKIFGEGLLLLLDLLNLIEAAASENEEELADEIKELEREVVDGKFGENILAIKQKNLASKKTRLEKIVKNKDMMELFLVRADECENTLRATQDNLVKIRVESSEDALDDVLKELQSRIQVVIEVRKQMKNEIELGISTQ